MTRYGEGSVFYEEARTRWVGTIDLGQDHNGKRRRRKVTGPTAKAVKAKLRTLRDQTTAADQHDGNLTVGSFLTDWLAREVPKFSASPNTVDNYRWAIDGHLIPALGTIRLARLTADDVDLMLEGKAGDGLARNSLVRLRSVLVRALNHAERRGRVVRNVARLTSTPDGPKAERRSLTAEQAKKLLAAAEGDRLEPLVLVGLALGLRPGELTGLTWECVDLETGIVHVRQSLKRENNHLRLGGLKTPRARRSLRMPEVVHRSLKAHRTAQVADRLAAGPLWSSDWPDLVFTAPLGTPIDPSNLRRDFQHLCNRAEIGKWTPYELRHSAASLLSAAGVPLELIADTLGHDGTRMTASVYRHALAPTVDAAAAPMDALLG